MIDPIHLDAAERTIEADSFLQAAYAETDDRFPIRVRIQQVFDTYIKYNQAMYQAYLTTKRELEAESEKI